jgi:transposase-like protein
VGNAGLIGVPRGKAHPPEVRAAVVAALCTGAAFSAVCDEFDVPYRTAKDWLDAAAASSSLVRISGDEARTRRELDLEELVGRLVSSSIEALVTQAGLAAERTWFAAQDAQGIAAYRGVEFDRLLRLLRAFQRDQPGAEPQPVAIDGQLAEPARLGDPARGDRQPD